MSKSKKPIIKLHKNIIKVCCSLLAVARLEYTAENIAMIEKEQINLDAVNQWLSLFLSSAREISASK
jgi:hypothetical protein